MCALGRYLFFSNNSNYTPCYFSPLSEIRVQWRKIVECIGLNEKDKYSKKKNLTILRFVSHALVLMPSLLSFTLKRYLQLWQTAIFSYLLFQSTTKYLTVGTDRFDRQCRHRSDWSIIFENKDIFQLLHLRLKRKKMALVTFHEHINYNTLSLKPPIILRISNSLGRNFLNFYYLKWGITVSKILYRKLA